MIRTLGCTQTKPFMLWFVNHFMFLSPGDQYSIFQCHCIVLLHNEIKNKKRQLLLFHRSATASLHLHATTNCSTIPPFTSPTPSDVPPRLPSNSVLDLSLSRQQHILLHSPDSPFVTSRRCTSAASCTGPTGGTHVPHNGQIVLLSRFYLEATLKSADRQRASVCLAESASTPAAWAASAAALDLLRKVMMMQR